MCNKQVVVAVHKRRMSIRSQSQSLSELASGIRVLSKSPAKFQKMALEEERRRDERFTTAMDSSH